MCVLGRPNIEKFRAEKWKKVCIGVCVWGGGGGATYKFENLM